MDNRRGEKSARIIALAHAFPRKFAKEQQRERIPSHDKERNGRQN